MSRDVSCCAGDGHLELKPIWEADGELPAAAFNGLVAEHGPEHRHPEVQMRAHTARNGQKPSKVKRTRLTAGRCYF